MSKLYNIYLSLKENQEDSDKTLYLFKSGMFFIFIDQDALIASRLLNLKLTNLNSSVVKCGFPISSLDKFVELLQHTNYSLKIIDNISNVSYNLTDYKINSSINSLLYDIDNMDINSLSVGEAFSFLEKIKKTTKQILKGDTPA